VLISSSLKQHEACQSVPRSPQHRHQLYSNEQQQPTLQAQQANDPSRVVGSYQ
ncbi:unnamed protein product, partial [Adineta steineri]